MAVYPPPTEDLPIFDNNVFTSGNELLTVDFANNNYLKFPIAQGTETFGDLISNGTATLNIAQFKNGASSSNIQQTATNTLTIDNNFATSGNIVFKANNSGSAEQTILTLNGDTGTTSALPIVVSSATERTTISPVGMFCENIATPAVNTLYELIGVSIFYPGGFSAYFDYQQLQLNGGGAASQSTLTSSSLNFTDGTISNTLDKNNWSGNIQTVNTVANSTHFLNFSDSSGTGYGRPQKTAGISCNPSTNTITATTFSGALSGTATNANNMLITSDNTSGTYYIPFSKTTAGTNPLFIDDTTGPLTYNPSSGLLTVNQIGGLASLFTTSATSNGNIFTNNTTGSVNIMTLAQTTGNVLLGSTTATSGVVSVRPQLVVGRQIQTSLTSTPSLVNHLGYTIQTLGTAFSTNTLLASTNTNLMSYAFTSDNFGTYLFTSNVVMIPPTFTTNQAIIAISNTSLNTTTPFISLQSPNVSSGSAYLSVSCVIQIYSAQTIYLVGFMNGFTASVNNALTHFTYTRIA